MPIWRRPYGWYRSTMGLIPAIFRWSRSVAPGGMHACELARSLGIPRVIVPALPGALSALGILMSDVVEDHSRTSCCGSRTCPENVEGDFRELRAKLNASWLKKLARPRHRWSAVATCAIGDRDLGSPPSARILWNASMPSTNGATDIASPEREVEIVTLRMPEGRIASPEKLARTWRISKGDERTS